MGRAVCFPVAPCSPCWDLSGGHDPNPCTGSSSRCEAGLQAGLPELVGFAGGHPPGWGFSSGALVGGDGEGRAALSHREERLNTRESNQGSASRSREAERKGTQAAPACCRRFKGPFQRLSPQSRSLQRH